MTPPLGFRPQPTVSDRQAPPSGGFNITLTIGPFLDGDTVPPDWAKVAEWVIAECQLAWQRGRANAPTSGL